MGSEPHSAEQAFAALERAERFVASIEGKNIDETGMPNYAHAPAIATARADLRNVLEASLAREAALRKSEAKLWAHLLWAHEQLRSWWRGAGRDTSDPGAAIAEINWVESVLAASRPAAEEEA